MKCPVCEKELASMACACGYDRSRDYGKYPTLGALPAGVESVSALRERRKELVRCGGCGGHTFTLSSRTGALVCTGCGRALSEGELKPLTDALGMRKTEPKPEKSPAPAIEKSSTERLSEFSDLLNTLKQQAARQDNPKPEPKPEAGRKEPAAQTNEKSSTERLSEFGDLLNVLKQQAARQQKPEQTDPRGEDPRRIVSVAAGNDHTVVLYADGTAAAVGRNRDQECCLDHWRDIVAISAGCYHTVGLKKDGTVEYAGNSYGNQKDAKNWEDIVAIATGTFHTVGLKRDGTVVAVGDKSGGKCAVAGWRDIVAIDAGYKHTIALDKFGRVFTAGKAKGTKLPWGGWNQVKAIAAGGFGHSAALTENGAVLLAGGGGKPAELGEANVEMDAGFDYTVVRRADGTAKISGNAYEGREKVRTWTDLEKISAGNLHVVGLKKDGTLIAAGNNSNGQCDVHKLMRK